MKTILLRSKNIAATEFYYNTIRKGMDQCSEVLFDGFEDDSFPKDKDAIVIVGSCMSMLRVWCKGYRKIVTWYQGVLPEESYMRNGSYMRKSVLSAIEKFSLKHSLASVFVSDALRYHYEEKYGLELDRYYVMPCFNAEYQKDRILAKDYSQKIFTYTGGLSKWQCIDQTLALYKRIEDASGGQTKLLILTAEQDKAATMVQQYGIQNAQIRFVHYSKLPDVLQTASFGFNLRQNNAVNRVSTPTKLANYLSCGIIPIYMNCILDFDTISQNNPYKLVLNDADNITDEQLQQILDMMEKDISSADVEQEFSRYFEQYYNVQWHADKIAEWLKGLEHDSSQ